MFLPEELERQELEEVKFVIDVNFVGTFLLIRPLSLRGRTGGDVGGLGVRLCLFRPVKSSSLSISGS